MVLTIKKYQHSTITNSGTIYRMNTIYDGFNQILFYRRILEDAMVFPALLQKKQIEKGSTMQILVETDVRTEVESLKPIIR